MSPVQSRWFLRSSLLGLALSWTACGDPEVPAEPASPAPPPSQTEASVVDKVDLLFVIDNSGSMASEQERLGRELSRLLTALTTGDRRPDAPHGPGRGDPSRYFSPVASLHVGVVSTNLGGMDEAYNPNGNHPAVQSCQGLGDDGVLQQGTAIAQSGVVAERNMEFAGFNIGDVVLAPDPSCTLGEQPTYQAFTAGVDLSAERIAQAFRCVSRLGVRGCPFEQPLEAMWKALAPSAGVGELYQFLNDSRGQGDRRNAGFLRPDALLAVMIVTDEEDCSITQAGKPLLDVDPRSEAMQLGPVNLRCMFHGESNAMLRSPERYVEGLKSLKPGHPERIVLGAIVGIAPDLPPGLTIDEILARPEMQYRLGPAASPGIAAPSCVRADAANPARDDTAFPPRRILQVAKAFGENAVLHSICADRFAPALDSWVDRIARQLGS